MSTPTGLTHISLNNASDLIMANAKYALANHASHIVPLLFSAPGVGKTEVVRSLASYDPMNPYHVEIIDMNTVMAGSLAMPVANADSESVAYKLHPQLLNVKHIAEQNPTKPVFLALDEVNRADENFTRPQLLNLLLSNTIADTKLPENVFIVGMSNLPEQAFGSGENQIILSNDVTEFDSAMSNRFMSLFIQPNVDEWLTMYAMKYNEDIQDTNIHADIITYIQSGADGAVNNNADLLYNPTDEDNVNKAFATPRSWTALSQLLRNPAIANNLELLKPAAAGIIGDAQAKAFFKWRQNNKKTAPVKKIMEGKELFEDHYKDASIAEVNQFFNMAINYARTPEQQELFMRLFIKHSTAQQRFTWTKLYTNNLLHRQVPDFYEHMLKAETETAKEFLKIRLEHNVN